jgi:hypothetical protein
MKHPSRMAALALALASLAPAARTLADERILAVVQHVKVTHCDAKKAGGCAGTLTLERTGKPRAEHFTVRVPLGTPISCADERVLLHTLQGKAALITLHCDRREAVARAIQLAGEGC